MYVLNIRKEILKFNTAKIIQRSKSEWKMDAEKGGVSNSAVAGSVLGQAAEVTVHSGNIASWNKLRRKGVMTSTDEVNHA